MWRATAEQRRDSVDYLGWTERDFPRLFADYQAGEFGSVTEPPLQPASRS